MTTKHGKTLKKGGKRTLIAAFLLFLLLAFIALAGIGNYFVNYALVPSPGRGDQVAPAADPSMTPEDVSVIAANRILDNQQTDLWVKENPPQVLSVQSQDGLRLEADLFLQPSPSHRWVLLAHGYESRRENMRSMGSFYAEQGFNVLIPDMRAHGQSEGKYIGMGWLDRKDLLVWIDKILKQDPQAQIVLHGVSMGAAAVMMVSGEALPPQVKAIVEDCGYTSVWDIFSDELNYLFHLPPFPVLYASDAMARIRAGYGLKEASALKQVKKCTTPMLFIHGSNDTFVRPSMARTLYEAASCEKMLLIIPGAGHGESYLRDPDRYFNTVFGFIGRYLDPENP